MKTLHPVCECGSTEFRSNDHIMCSTDIGELTLTDDGKLDVEFDDAGAENYWDTCEPVNEALPYECSECQKGYDDAMLIAAHQDEEEEED